ncbi:hypothetical protein FOMPIDRAFT_89403 [Fomitopsis schrenkii]|uniref:Structure-specific endonuclease subunit SLX4 n=1 Tax=Fomitopsis schrenkii TaxID=2126942 RepID=S8FWW0_FOMSC|nr:hypothetical protein FOMPIDRAFT_89403 [Fomitopsis schrenkii]
MHRTPGTLAPTHLAARARLTPVGARVHTGHANVSEVSDSEPEREGRRKTEKQSRKRQKKHHLPLQCQADVIELTDSQEPILTQPTSQPSQVPPTTQSVISIHDDSSEGGIPDEGRRDNQEPKVLDEDIIEISEGTTDDPSMPSAHVLLATRPQSPEYVEPPIDIPQPISARSSSSRTSPDASDSEDEPRAGLNLKLKSFAYAGSTSGRSRNPSSANTASRSGSVISAASVPKRTRAQSKAKASFADEFSDADLARLLKCVSCDLTWTTRKSAAQKVKHIQTCAKKRALTDSTVAFLLRSELAVAPPLPEKKGSAEEKAKEPGTLLETWTDGTNKKRTKRGTAPETVRSLADTRGQILDRARALLSDKQPRRDDKELTTAQVGDGQAQMPPPTQTFGESALARSRHLQQDTVQPIAFASTQQFAPSKLAQFTATSITTVNTAGRKPSMPPPTQGFAPSRLGTTTSSARIFDAANEPSGSHFSFIPPPSRSANAASPMSPRMGSPPVDRHSPSSISISSGSDLESPQHVDVDVIEYDERPEDWGMDEAYLHFDPDVPFEDHAQPAVEQRSLSPAGPSQLSVSTRETEPRYAATREPEVTATVPPAKKPRSRKGKQPVSSPHVKESMPEATDAEFESRMHAAIMQDKALHLRIIRYEPIHFDVFMQLATDAELVPARKLGVAKSRVRAFLDKMAIHFYGADGLGGDRTRKRHP